MSAQFVARPRPYPDVHAPGASAPKSNQISERGTRSPPLPLVSVENQVFLTLVAVQAELRKLGRGWQPADERERRVALENAQLIRGLIEAGSNQLGEAHVKRLQVAAGGETPLMICAGKVRLLGAEEEGPATALADGLVRRVRCGGADSTRVVPRAIAPTAAPAIASTRTGSTGSENGRCISPSSTIACGDSARRPANRSTSPFAGAALWWCRQTCDRRRVRIVGAEGVSSADGARLRRRRQPLVTSN